MSVVWKVDDQNPDPGIIDRAAAVLRAGRLVAFPTETVYGLGANARNADAVRSIFAAKGRPATNPVIVHVAEIAGLNEVVASIPQSALVLMEHFWPGPLTLVLPRHPAIPDVVSAGGPTVAVRSPRHPVAQALIRAAGFPIAAPSANRSTQLSPTRAEHVVNGLGSRVDLILDGGPCSGGIESTVLDLATSKPRILRPGLVTAAMLEPYLGKVELGASAESAIARSPGLMAKHYSPKTPVEIVECASFAHRRAACESQGLRIAVLTLHADATMPVDPQSYAAELYSRLHQLDEQRLDRILIEQLPDRPEWLALRDRLARAAGEAASDVAK